MKKNKQKDFEFMDTAAKSLYEVFWDSVREDEILKRHRIELENIDLKKENEQIKHQLAEKDEEIANIRHQVCQEIREKAFRDCIGLKESKNFYHYVISPEILDQIEGEKEC